MIGRRSPTYPVQTEHLFGKNGVCIFPPSKGVRGMTVKPFCLHIPGRKITELVKQKLQAVTYEVEWNALNYPSGVYFYKFEAFEYHKAER